MKNTVLQFTHNGLGQGDATLQARLAENYFAALIEGEIAPAAIVFYAAGVLLTESDSPCRPLLDKLSIQGIPLVACRTCLSYYEISERVPESWQGNMLQIIEWQQRAAKVINL